MAEQETTGDTSILLAGNQESFTFTGFAVPEQITFGGEQSLAVHALPGGSRVTESLGRNDGSISWSARFQGSGAEQEAYYVNYLRVLGKPLTLSWAEHKYDVLLKTFTAQYQRHYQIPYSIEFVVVEDLALPTPSGEVQDVDRTVKDANARLKTDAKGMTGTISSASSSWETVKSGMESAGKVVEDVAHGIQDVVDVVLAPVHLAVEAVEDIADASTKMIGDMLDPVINAHRTVGGLANHVNGTVANVPFLGNVVPDKLIDVNTSDLLSHTGAFGTTATLIDTQRQLGNMSTYLSGLRNSPRLVSTIGESTSQVVTASTTAGDTIVRSGGNLFQIASEQYGDPSKWTAIAEANDMVDPIFDGVKTLVIPKNPPDSGGVLV